MTVKLYRVNSHIVSSFHDALVDTKTKFFAISVLKFVIFCGNLKCIQSFSLLC